MRILAAFDKFKDSMSAATACDQAALGIHTALSDGVEVIRAPLTDGGEGFCTILTHAVGGYLTHHPVSGPLGAAVEAPLGWIDFGLLPPSISESFPNVRGKLAVIEMASVAGLEQVAPGDRDPRNCSTHGVGELIRIAADDGAAAILLGIGGSATSDLGLGALEVLGLEFSGAARITPAHWPGVHSIKGQSIGIPPIFIACDVDNPLCGPRGAARVYGPQKGLPHEEVDDFDAQASRVADLLCDFYQQPRSCKDAPSSGAAGGMGFGLQVAFGATYLPGFDLVRAWLDLDQKMAAVDLVLSGEGRIDPSSLSGKGPIALAEAAHRLGVPCELFAGQVVPETAHQIQSRFPRTRIHAITPEELVLAEALRRGPENLTNSIAKRLREIRC